MLGGLGAFLASEVSGAVKRNVTIYVLYGAAVLLLICAGGYGLNALHTVLTLYYGAVAASLWIAGGLLVVSLLLLGIATYVKNRPRPARPLAATALVAAPVAARVLGSKGGWKALLVGGVVILGAVLGKQLFSGSGDAGDES